MKSIILISIALIILVVLINILAIWLTRKGMTRDDNKNMIPDILEEKLAEIKYEVNTTVSRVGQELKDVSKAIKEVGNQIGDIPGAVTGKERSGRKTKK